MIDTHTAVKQLIEAGRPEMQAEVVVQTQQQFVEGEVATRAALAGVRQDIAEVRHEVELVRKDVGALEFELQDQKFEALDQKFMKKLDKQTSDMTVRLGGLIVLAIAILVALYRLAGSGL